MRADFEQQPFRTRFVYSIADIVSANVRGEGDFNGGYFGDLFDTPAKALRPHKDTLLHEVIRNLDGFYNDYWLRKAFEESTESFRAQLVEADITVPEWLVGEIDYERKGEVRALLSEATRRITPSVFYILFSDRQFLTDFSGHVAGLVEGLSKDDHPTLHSDGRVARLGSLPSWLKQAVFYRDRGRCQHCWKDLSGLSRPVADLQLDHIVPLIAGGSNDPTNFQLSCAPCNQRKGGRPRNARPRFTPYW